MPNKQTIGNRLREIRIKLGMTGKGVSEATGIASATISQIENDVNKPSADILIDLANYYDVTTDYILGLTKQEDKLTSDLLESFYNLNEHDKIKVVMAVKKLEYKGNLEKKINSYS